MVSVLVFILLGVVSPGLANPDYDLIWANMLAENQPPLTPDMIGLYFRSMMEPAPEAGDPTLVSRDQFKTYWMPQYQEVEKIADGLFSYFDHHKDEFIDAQDIPGLMNIADTNFDGVLSRDEFDIYMDAAYAYAEQRRLNNNGNAFGHGDDHNPQHHNHHNQHGKPFFG